MNADAGPADDPETVPLRVRRTGRMDLDRAMGALGELSWLGPTTDGPQGHPELRQVVTDLELPSRIGSSRGPLRKSTLVDVGLARRIGDQVLVGISWQSANLAPLFPVFAGELSVSEDEIVLDGRYAPPLGTLGLLIDQALLHFVARRTASVLVERFAREFGG